MIPDAAARTAGGEPSTASSKLFSSRLKSSATFGQTSSAQAANNLMASAAYVSFGLPSYSVFLFLLSSSSFLISDGRDSDGRDSFMLDGRSSFMEVSDGVDSEFKEEGGLRW